MLACPVGLIITAIMTDKFGRLFALKFAYVPMILGWTLLVFADSFVEIMITRILIGLPFGKICFFFVSIVYDENRSILSRGKRNVTGKR